MKEYICRTCGLEYQTPTWEDEGSASYDICNCCEVEFGIQDNTYKGVLEYRKKWLDSGALWADSKMKPKEWDLEKQLKNIPEKWK